MVPESLRLYSPSVLKVVVFEARDQESIELFHKACLVHWRRSDLSHLTSESQCAGKLRLRCWDLWAWHWHPRLRQGLSKKGGILYVVHLFQLSMNFMEHFLHHDLIVVWTRNPSQTFEVLQGGGMLLIREVGHWVHFSTDIIANRADHQFRSQGCWGCSD